MSNPSPSVAFAPANVPSLMMPAKKYDPDSMLARLMNIGKPGTGCATTISEQEMHEMTLAVKDLFLLQPMMLELQAPVMICGDIHGQFGDLIRLFNQIGWPPTQNYLFLGDYVDRGRWSVETILLLFCLKLKYPSNFLLLRGNHETVIVNRIYGFYEDLNRRFCTPRLFNIFQEVFNVMPLVATINDRIICMHGGLSPDLLTMPTLAGLNEIKRPLPDPPNPSLPLDLLWSDPNVGTKQFQQNIRGVSCTFGQEVVTEFCKKFDIDVVVRAHQVVQDGYEFFCNKKLVTIFSAPHYCGQFDNAAAVMVVSKDLKCSFRVLRPQFPGRAVKQSTNKDVTVYGKLPA